METKTFNERVNEEILKLTEERCCLLSDLSRIFAKHEGRKMKKKHRKYFYECLSDIKMDVITLEFSEKAEKDGWEEELLSWLKDNYNQDTGNDEILIFHEDDIEKNGFALELLPMNMRALERVKRKHDGTGTLCGDVYGEKLLEYLNNSECKNEIDNKVRSVLRLSFMEERIRLLREITDKMIPYVLSFELPCFFEEKPFEKMNGMITSSNLWEVLLSIDRISLLDIEKDLISYAEYDIDKDNFINTYNLVMNELISEIARIVVNFKLHPWPNRMFGLPSVNLEANENIYQKNLEKLLINYKAKC